MTAKNTILNTTFWIIKVLWIIFVVFTVAMGILTILALVSSDIASALTSQKEIIHSVQSSRILIEFESPTSTQAAIINLIFCTLNSGLCLTIVWILKRIFINVKAGEIFTMQNVIHVRNIAFLTIVGSILIHFLLCFVALLAQSKSGTHAAINFFPDLTPVFFGLLILALAEVFKYGVELQTDHDLTV